MEKKITLAIVLIVSFIAILPLIHRGLHPTHDGEYHVIRFYEFSKAIKDGNLYPRWAPDLNYGFGIPLFNYNYPLPNYVSHFLHVFGLSFIDAFKFNMILASFLGSIFFFLWVRQFFGDIGGMVGSVFYTFSPYRFLDIYIRGSVGEVWALVFFPAFLWSITVYFKNRQGKHFILSAAFFALLIFSHNILALMFFPFALSYVVFLIVHSLRKEKRRLLDFLLILILGLGLSAIFWLPAIYEKGYTVGLQINDYSPNFPQLYQLIFPYWGSGFSGGPLASQLSYQIGVANLLAVVLGILVIFKKIDKEKKRIIVFSLIGFTLIFFLMLEASAPVWRVVPFMDYFQFPWRFLSLEIVLASFLAGSIIYLGKPRIIALFLIALTIMLGIGYTKPAYYHQRDDDYYISRSNFIDGTNSIGNAFNTVWARNINKREDKLVLSKGEGAINVKSIKSNKYEFDTTLSQGGVITVNTAYFPGWTVYMDGVKVDSSITESGAFSFNAPSGDKSVVVKFEDTVVRKFASILTLSSLLFVLLYWLLFVRIKR